MKILFIISDFASGGAEKIVETLIRDLDARGNDVTLAIFNSADLNRVQQRMPERCAVISFEKDRRSPVSFLDLFRGYLRSGVQFDIIIANLHPVAFYFGLLLNALRCPVVYIIHNDYSLLSNPLKRIVLRRFYSSPVVTLVSVSEQIAVSFYKKHRIKPVVIDNGISPPAVSSGQAEAKAEIESLRPDSSTIVFAGVQRLTWFKNLPALAEAFKIIHNRGHNAALILIGDDPLEGKPEEGRIRAVGAPNVFLLGHRDNVADYLGQADCFCIVSSAFEGAPVALLEAISSGLPVIGTRTGGIPSVIRDPDNGILCDPTVESITGALIRFIDMPGPEKNRMGEANRQLYETRYTETAMTRQYADLISRLTRESR
jgi:glycosyltransferase involved in cell wall biosynthesis